MTHILKLAMISSLRDWEDTDWDAVSDVGCGNHQGTSETLKRED